MRNRFAGSCYRCGGHVPEGDGHFEKVPTAFQMALGLPRWRVQHADCCLYYSGDRTARGPRPTASQMADWHRRQREAS